MKEKAQKQIHKMISESRSAVKAKFIIFEDSLDKHAVSNSQYMRWFYLFFGWFMIFAALLLLLDELDMGDLALAGVQAGIIWASDGSNKGWLILACTIVPVVIMVIFAVLYNLGLIKLASDLLEQKNTKNKKKLFRSKILWDYIVSCSSLLQAIRERERVHLDYDGA